MKQVSNNSVGPLDLFRDAAKKNADANPPKTTPLNTIFNDGDGFVARNDDGLIVEKYFLDSHGTTVAHEKYEYDENGNMTRKLHDDSGAAADGRYPDGVADFITTYEYDENGNMTRELRDDSGAGADKKDPDGVADYIITYEYDENGNMTRKLRDYRGAGADKRDPDGVADSAFYYIRNEEGEVTHRGLDADGDGVIDRFQKNLKQE